MKKCAVLKTLFLEVYCYLLVCHLVLEINGPLIMKFQAAEGASVPSLGLSNKAVDASSGDAKVTSEKDRHVKDQVFRALALAFGINMGLKVGLLCEYICISIQAHSCNHFENVGVAFTERCHV